MRNVPNQAGFASDSGLGIKLPVLRSTPISSGRQTLSRLEPIQTQEATSKTKELLEAVQAKLKIARHMAKVMANSAVVLKGYLSFHRALSGAVLRAKLGEEIAVEVGKLNACQYCVSVRTAIGRMAGHSDAPIENARKAQSSSPKGGVALAIAQELVV
jgi:AhpD family alkylhydroperoxidase